MTAPTNGSPRFQPKDRPLRRDVGFVGALLGDLLRDLEGEGLFEAVEGARLAARRRRKGEPGSEAGLAGRLEGLSAERALELVRAFSAYFGAVNMAEQVHRLRRRIAYRREGRQQPGGLRAARQDAATGLLDVTRLGMMLRRIRGRITHRALDRVSPLSVSVMLEIGRERVYGEGADEILAEAEAELLQEALA